MNHNLRRTNPKGERGLWQCLNCKQWGHFEKFQAFDCPMPTDQEIELLQAIHGTGFKDNSDG